MTTLLTIGANTYTGTVTIPPTTIATGYTNFLVDIGCASWTDPTSSAEVSLELSDDGGNTWMPWFSAMLYGGRSIDMASHFRTRSWERPHRKARRSCSKGLR